MVLPELGNPGGSNGDRDSFTDGAPTSDGDSYATSSSTDQPPNSIPVHQPNGPIVYISRDNLPSYRVSDSGLAKVLSFDLSGASKRLQRPLTQDEVNALAEHDARMIQVSNNWGDFGMGYALYQLIKGRRTRSFPLWKPDANTNFNAIGPLTGRPASLVWSSARFVAWFAAGQLVALTGATVHHSAVTFPRRWQDPRLREINESLRNRRQEGSSATRTPDMTPGPRPGETTEMARQREQIQRIQRVRQRQQEQQQQAQTSSSSYDDMSPTGGAFNRDIYSTRSTSAPDFVSDAEIERQYATSSASTSSSSPSYSNYNSDNPQPSPADSTAKAPSSSSTATSAQPQPQSGSAWDRLRQEALSGSNNTPKSRPQSSAPPQNTGDSSFWQTDDDKQRADAQREFDARIERERAGGDFNDNPKGKGGWP